ncbi:MAG: hypothetical protein AB1468_05690 [Candidatus Micrarchaeota archaeon]
MSEKHGHGEGREEKGMQDEEFVREIGSLKETEKEAEKIVNRARGRAESMGRRARERAKRIVDEAGKEAVDEKNRMLAEARKETKKEGDRIIHEAEKKGDELRAQEVDESVPRDVAGKIFKL